MYNLPIMSTHLIENIKKDINKVFEDFPGIENTNYIKEKFSLPRVDIKDEKDKIFLKADLPGIDPKDVKVGITNNVLFIRASHSEKTENKKEGYVRIERSLKDYYREFSLPTNVKIEDINARTKHGVLEVIIPKS